MTIDETKKANIIEWLNGYMNDIEKSIVEIKNHAERNLKVKLSEATANMAIQAIEKQVPKKVYIENIRKEIFRYLCPNCFNAIDENQKHCDDCGQALDWRR